MLDAHKSIAIATEPTLDPLIEVCPTSLLGSLPKTLVKIDFPPRLIARNRKDLQSTASRDVKAPYHSSPFAPNPSRLRQSRNLLSDRTCHLTDRHRGRSGPSRALWDREPETVSAAFQTCSPPRDAQTHRRHTCQMALHLEAFDPHLKTRTAPLDL